MIDPLWSPLAPSQVSSSTKSSSRTAGKAEHNSPFPGFAHTPCLFCWWALEYLKGKQTDRSCCSLVASDGATKGLRLPVILGRWPRHLWEVALGTHGRLTFCDCLLSNLIWSRLGAALTLGVDDLWGAEGRCPLSFLALCEQLLMPWTCGALPTDLQCGTPHAPQWLWPPCPEEQANPSAGKAGEGRAPNNSSFLCLNGDKHHTLGLGFWVR